MTKVVTNEVMGNPVDVPGNADRINESENEHDPERDARKKIEHAEEVSGVQKSGGNWDCIPPCVRKHPRIGRWAFDNYEFA